LILLRRVAVVFFIALLPLHAQSQAWGWEDGSVPYVNTPMEIVERMLRMAEVKSGDYVIDLGSGDGRIVIEAAKRGARGLGVDYDPRLVEAARGNARKAGVANRARFETRDIFDTDLSRASVITMYLLLDSCPPTHTASGRATSASMAAPGASASRRNSRCSTSTLRLKDATFWCARAACAARKSSWWSAAS
jgi:SAM-dependent methyltransferase